MRGHHWQLFVLALVLVVVAPVHAAPRLLARHKGTTTLQLSGRTRLTLSQGCFQLPVGQGRPWKISTRKGAQIASDTRAGLSVRNGKLTIDAASVRSQLKHASIDNPMEVLRGMVHGAPKPGLLGLVRRGVNSLADGGLSYTPTTFTMERRAGSNGSVDVGLRGKLHLGGSIDRSHAWSETYAHDAARRWIHSTFGGSSGSRARLASILGRLAPAERAAVTGLVETQLEGQAEATASLSAGQHRLPGGACTITIADGAKANLQLKLAGRASGGKLRITSTSATVGLSKPVRVERPLAALHALRRGGRGTGLGRALRGALDRMLDVSVDSLQLQRRGGAAATKVQLSGTLRLFNRFSFKLRRQVSLRDSQLGASLSPAELTGLFSSAQSRLDLTLKGQGGASPLLKLQTRPSLRVDQGALSFTAPVELQTPNLQGSYSVEGSHQF